jgi:NADH:ubiquinone oxidoreductase subunit 3 (subunit A)
MLRALGFKSSHLVSMITMQSFFYSVPGVILGIGVAFVTNVLLRFFIYIFAGNTASFELTSASLWIGILFGLIMPLLAILLPIKQALGKNLRTSLDLNHRSNNEKSVTVQKLEDLGLSPNQTLVGIMLVVLGFITYYCVPLTFYYQKTEWFLFIFDTLLVMIIIGLTFMSVLIFEFVEKGLLWLLINTCCRRDKRLKDVISKNLDGHRKRNSKTSIMFTLAISFLIFASSSFTLLSGLIQGEVITLFGSDLYIDQIQVNRGIFLDEADLTEFIVDINARYPGSIADYSFVSTPISTLTELLMNDDYKTSFSDLTGYNLINIAISAVPDNYLSTIDMNYYYPNDFQKNIAHNKTDGQINAVDMIYSD